MRRPDWVLPHGDRAGQKAGLSPTRLSVLSRFSWARISSHVKSGGLGGGPGRGREGDWTLEAEVA